MKKTTAVLIAFIGSLLFMPISTKAIEIQVQQKLEATANHGIQKLTEAFESRHLKLSIGELGADTKEKYVICAGLASHPYISKSLQEKNITISDTPEALAVHVILDNNQTRLIIAGADAVGIMYAALDIAEQIKHAPSVQDFFSTIEDINESPFITDRSVSTYTMNRSLFEQRLFDKQYWTTYFDMLATNRINSYVFIFGYECAGFMAPMFPYFFDVEAYPQVQFNGLSKKEQALNREAMQTVINLAHERGIRITFGLWDHIYRGAVQAGRIEWAPRTITPETPNVVSGVTTENLAPYTKAALRELLSVFPDIDALQFRMHNESGLKVEEIPVFWEDVFSMLRELKPSLTFDLRAKGLPEEVIQNAIDTELPFRIATKFWMEQIGMPFHPTHVHPQNQKGKRHGYANLIRYPKEYDVHWRVWSGGTLRLLLWGDPNFVRRFVTESVPVYGGNSFEINEMLATKMLSVKHDTKPHQIHTSKYQYYDYEMERYWHYYQLWGRLSYNPEANPSIWEREFTQRFGDDTGLQVMNTLHQASEVLPRIVASSTNYLYFPVTRGWATMMRMGDLDIYAKDSGTDTEQFQSYYDAAKQLLHGGETSMLTPYQNKVWFEQTADFLLKKVNEISNGKMPRNQKRKLELETSLVDFQILAFLSQYHAERIPAAIWYNIYKETNDEFAIDKAIEAEGKAIGAWEKIVKVADGVYGENLRFGSKAMSTEGAALYEAEKGKPYWEIHPRSFPENWAEELTKLQEGLAELKKLKGENSLNKATHQKLIAGMEARPRSSLVAEVVKSKSAVPGKDYKIQIKVTEANKVDKIRLRYRHLTQFEDYKSVDMLQGLAENIFEASIPGAFIEQRWDLMYFVEIIDSEGGGIRMPDFDKEMPYVIVHIKR
ncbi:hypothetical protein [Labilibacter marinus]|uniref:hypothetical protein n=1 Tax=Labilibacter marinus TaxID=1477105 RepID=UPI001179F257|nr:hypothetical protein [Labilibacter marinus]